MKSIAVIIHARTQSSRCPNKHLRDLGDGNTLIDIALNNLNKINNVEEKYFAVGEKILSDKVIGDICILNRKFESIAPGNPPLYIFYEHLLDVKSDYIVLFNPCQPFLNVNKLQQMIDWFKSADYENVMTVRKVKNFFWDKDLNAINFSTGDRISTVDGPHVYTATHSLIGFNKKYMLNEHHYFSDLPYPYVVDWSEEEIFDVDTELDFNIMRKMYEENNK